MCREEEILHELLRYCRRASCDLAGFAAFFRHLPDLQPIDAVMFVKAAVFRSDDGVLQVGSNACSRCERTLPGKTRTTDNRLEAALKLNTGDGRIDVLQHAKR